MSRYEQLSVGDLSIEGISLEDVAKTVAVAGEATLHALAGVVTSESLTTATGDNYVLRLSNRMIRDGDIVLAFALKGTNTVRRLQVIESLPAEGEVVIRVKNAGANPLNGTIKVAFIVVRVG